MSQAIFISPIGPILVQTARDELVAVQLGMTSAQPDDDAPLLREAFSQLDAWFDGRLTRFNLPLAPTTTARGAAHRDAIANVAYGTTASYGELARRLGSSPRAVGQACRRNPFPIIIPCHRIIATGGAIGHYSAADGIATKQWLLDHEMKKGR